MTVAGLGRKMNPDEALANEARRADAAAVKVLLFGKDGWIGGMIVRILQRHGVAVELARSRLEERQDVRDELDVVRPTHVVNAAGVTGRPNVDWCEDHKIETVRSNVIGALNLADLCAARDVHLTVLATGCIYSYDASHAQGSGRGFSEEDAPNFSGSFYSKTKGMVEAMLRCFPRTLILRFRMPISDDLAPRNFITKISSYERVVNVPNSVTVLHDLLPLALLMALRGLDGVFNFTNPGTISHNECLELYKEYIDPSFVYVNFSLEEQAKVLKAPRSNCELDCSKLLAAVPDVHVPRAEQAVRAAFARMRDERRSSRKSLAIGQCGPATRVAHALAKVEREVAVNPVHGKASLGK